jgi:hypothetical protein
LLELFKLQKVIDAVTSKAHHREEYNDKENENEKVV